MVKVKSEREQVQSVTTKLKGHHQQIELKQDNHSQYAGQQAARQTIETMRQLLPQMDELMNQLGQCLDTVSQNIETIDQSYGGK